MSESEKVKKQSVQRGPNGGARPGAGRPKGKANAATLRRAKVLEAYKRRVEKHTQQLLDAQLTLARGVTTLWRIPKEIEIKRNRQGEEYEVEKRGKPEMVTSQAMVAQYLAGDFEGDPKADYYFITTDKPDNRALDSMLDRTYGKATQPLTGDPEDPNGGLVGVVMYKPGKLDDGYENASS
jgi:hypothetical protein